MSVGGGEREREKVDILLMGQVASGDMTPLFEGMRNAKRRKKPGEDTGQNLIPHRLKHRAYKPTN